MYMQIISALEKISKTNITYYFKWMSEFLSFLRVKIKEIIRKSLISKSKILFLQIFIFQKASYTLMISIVI